MTVHLHIIGLENKQIIAGEQLTPLDKSQFS